LGRVCAVECSHIDSAAVGRGALPTDVVERAGLEEEAILGAGEGHGLSHVEAAPVDGVTGR